MIFIRCKILLVYIFFLVPQNRIIDLSYGDFYCRVMNLNNIDKNSVISNYYQRGPGCIRDYVLNELLMVKMCSYIIFVDFCFTTMKLNSSLLFCFPKILTD